MFEKYFKYSAPDVLAKELFRTKKNKKNNDSANSIMVKWSILKDEFEKMSEDKKEIEQPDKVLKIVKEIIEFKKKIQSGHGLKILTPNQMLSRLPIILSQLKAGNNSEQLINEIRNYCILCIDKKNLQNNYIKV